MKTIFAKFNSTCANSGKQIKKGMLMVYDYQSKKCYLPEFAPKEDTSLSNHIQAQEDSYFDNFCYSNGI